VLFRSPSPNKMQEVLDVLVQPLKEEKAKKFLAGVSAQLKTGPAARTQVAPFSLASEAARPSEAKASPDTTVVSGGLEMAEPTSRDEFLLAVGRLKGIDMKQAKEYHDKWAGKFQK
jgi:hypothetical protein